MSSCATNLHLTIKHVEYRSVSIKESTSMCISPSARDSTGLPRLSGREHLLAAEPLGISPPRPVPLGMAIDVN